MKKGRTNTHLENLNEWGARRRAENFKPKNLLKKLIVCKEFSLASRWAMGVDLATRKIPISNFKHLRVARGERHTKHFLGWAGRTNQDSQNKRTKKRFHNFGGHPIMEKKNCVLSKLASFYPYGGWAQHTGTRNGQPKGYGTQQ